ncbi:malate:quinone oxidoreductase [Kineosporia babensis]|uniref:Probable malate:quinone oxidoreductase n=1 Tax=Kineosporia babensis TaxID=499548 RepID=A0A9X1SSX2_9ACTN|nr:malate:quinone oxidoreductase [Kineosporia babensis]MCD5311172.1 malate:quinone oxidoreductase [Kineosporia babensis]
MPRHHHYDAVLVGGGVMSATLATMLAELEPDWNVLVLEKLEQVGAESSDMWNNAGTGHAALCELNYTPAGPDGIIDISKAVAINEQFQASLQFWAHLVDRGVLADPSSFINTVPHMSFVRNDDVPFLRARYEALSQHPLFAGMQWTSDHAQLKEWAPLLVADRSTDEKVAATRAEAGTDVDFGTLTQQMLAGASKNGVEVLTGHTVKTLRRRDSGWMVRAKGPEGRFEVTTPFVFVGSGGGALHLLQRSGIPEGKGFGGFPVSGQWLRCTNPDVVEQHAAKVYGQAEVGAPPMSVPHLDTRYSNGTKALMFGPYAGFSPKFLKQGSLWDLPRSVKAHNLLPMLAVARDNVSLMTYLGRQIVQSMDQRLEALKTFYPDAREQDWELLTAGQRVQVIKKGPRGGVLQFGTELVRAADGSVAALLGASPGASTAVDVMLRLLTECFPARQEFWGERLRTMVPSYGMKLSDDPDLLSRTLAWTTDTLNLGETSPRGRTAAPSSPN